MRGHTEIDVPANPDKIELVLKAFKDNDVKTFADLGACWGVNGAYTNAALLSFKIARAYVVDTHPTNISRERLAPFGKKVKFLQGEFGYPEVYNKISEIDAVLLFDVLLHQANPDWNDILSIYAKKARVFVIFNQNFLGPKTLRLTDLGAKNYARIVPKRRAERDQELPKSVRQIFENLDQIVPGLTKTYRDAHCHGQWGITNEDLILTMSRLGYQMKFFGDFGPFGTTGFFRKHGYIFVRSTVEMPF